MQVSNVRVSKVMQPSGNFSFKYFHQGKGSGGKSCINLQKMSELPKIKLHFSYTITEEEKKAIVSKWGSKVVEWVV